MIPAEAMGAIISIASKGPAAPTVGKRVTVTAGRKHLGKCGTVIRHQRSAYVSDRYRSEASLMLRDAVQREGFVVLVKPEDGADFWVKAEYCEVAS